MSNIYVQEPPTSGKVVLRTSGGDVEVELWSKEAPKACRNFLQLSLEGYYDGCIFHRIIKDFLVQTGDPTGEGTGGESVYGEPFPNEIHSRLKFRSRGLLAMASEENEGNRSQFFITLGPCDWLDGQNTIFGKVVGDTIFNLVRFADFEVDAHDRPLFPPKLKKIEILSNPFDDILPRVTVSKSTEAGEKRPVQREAVKNRTLLSFADDEDEEESEEGDEVDRSKRKSVLVHPSVAQATREDPIVAAEPVKKQIDSEKTGKKSFIVDDSSDDDDDSGPEPEGRRPEKSADDQGLDVDQQKAVEAREEYKRIRDDLVRKKRSAKASLTSRKEDAQRLKQEEEFLSPLEARRAKYMHKRRVAEAGGREKKTLEKLRAFRGSVLGGKPKNGEADEETEGNENNSSEWMRHELVFPRDVHNQEDGYVVQDPLEVKRGKHAERIKKRTDDGFNLGEKKRKL
uniref:PPIase cyclophilin-type domain-containing protein n=1 Tax=Rhodosorus marinus TaxID=101924 RepID=A0A7S3E618_9RHOD|mmetsp:Transcript_11617/g.48330  ORF Transcript_11617/g.48330 Transcript_11617/m.48330 type:complete len:456 (+) Transcript_11617:92-1459(+)|eukprot:CAMPEP_0113961830 /NCGR_PEP_ID=MMETSP0011_2-20120614/5553_1 /TAXON_ID=101924 /ORGANISM="Rhodosorus marinus" /LENGTH=455 /DNA_ID=CAMNT_0000973567 /DNA_START=48 /DNA_END=1415 /DNA_ORIENTATION=- /assembly_acc=CAM_ASM_000156